MCTELRRRLGPGLCPCMESVFGGRCGVYGKTVALLPPRYFNQSSPERLREAVSRGRRHVAEGFSLDVANQGAEAEARDGCARIGRCPLEVGRAQSLPPRSLLPAARSFREKGHPLASRSPGRSGYIAI